MNEKILNCVSLKDRGGKIRKYGYYADDGVLNDKRQVVLNEFYGNYNQMSPKVKCKRFRFQQVGS